jgi:hypothetical protein
MRGRVSLTRKEVVGRDSSFAARRVQSLRDAHTQKLFTPRY